MSSQLPNYLRAHRKRLGLSQDDVSFLLGALSGTKVCRYERFARDPSLKTALSFATVFQKPIEELFQGLTRKAEKQIAERAKVLAHRIRLGEKSDRNDKRREVLLKIAEILENKGGKRT